MTRCALAVALALALGCSEHAPRNSAAPCCGREWPRRLETWPDPSTFHNPRYGHKTPWRGGGQFPESYLPALSEACGQDCADCACWFPSSPLDPTRDQMLDDCYCLEREGGAPMSRHGGRRHGLAPAGKAERLIVRLSPEDRAGLEQLAALWTRVESRVPAYTLAEVVRALIREAIADDRAMAATDDEVAAMWRPK